MARMVALNAVPRGGKIGPKALAAIMHAHWETTLTSEQRMRLAGDLARNGYPSKGSALPALIQFARDELDKRGQLIPWEWSPPTPQIRKTNLFPSPIQNPAVHRPFTTDSWSDHTALTKLGYRVGKSGKAIDDRRDILRRAYEVSPDQVPEDIAPYLDGWGGPATRQRLNAMINTISSNISRFRTRKSHATAVADWRADLAWVKKNLGHRASRR